VERKQAMIDKQPRQPSEGDDPSGGNLRARQPGLAADKTARGIRLFWD
jgi:hypothetical protein